MDYKTRNNVFNGNFNVVKYLYVIPEGNKRYFKINHLNIEFKLLTFSSSKYNFIICKDTYAEAILRYFE